MLVSSRANLIFLRHAARAAATSSSLPVPHAEKVDGVTYVSDAASASKALSVLKRCSDKVVAWDTETTGVDLRFGLLHSDRGRVVCATAYCGDDVDFGNGPRLLIDNVGPSQGLLPMFKGYFEDPQYKKVFHNYAFDRHMLKREGCPVQGLEADTLVLARIQDTAKSAWEGPARATMQQKNEQLKQSYERMQVAPAAPTYPVTRINFGGHAMDVKAVSMLMSGIHTVALPAVEDKKGGLQSNLLYGYDLKTLATTFGLTDKDQKLERFPFGAKADAALQALTSPETFTKFVEYATLDAVLTWRLFERLKLLLLERPWTTEVHKLPVLQLLSDDAAADAIAAELRSYGTKPKPFSCAGERKRASKSRSLAGTPGTVQLRTGQTIWDFYQQNLRELPECLAKMQDRGVPVDAATLERLVDISRGDLQTKTSLLRETLKSIRKPDGSALCEEVSAININSAQQLQTLLFGGARNKFNSFETLEVTRTFQSAEASGKKKFELSSLGLEPGKKKIDFTDKGWPSTRKEVMARLRSGGEVTRQLTEAGFNEEAVGNVEAALGYLSDCKQIETTARMLKALRTAVVKDRIHPSWQFATSTGRLTCSQPNLHSLVAGSKDIYGLRAAFKAQPGHKLVLADYSQLELRILAHISKCRVMSEGLHEGGDYHAQVAVEMFDHVREAVEKGDVTMDNDGARSVRSVFPEERNRAKAVNFGIIYGKTDSRLAEDLDMPREEATALMEAWFSSKPMVRSWKKRVEEHAQQERISLSLLGRERHLHLLDDQASAYHREKSKRAAVNFAIQGSAADIVTAVMLQLENCQELKKMGYHLIMQVHDEIILEGPDQHAEKAAGILKEIMSTPFKDIAPSYEFLVPLEVNIAIGDTLQAKA